MSPLKFFRTYNKWFLVVGASFLMVAFLIQPALSLFGPNPAKEPIGTIGDDITIRNEDTRRADVELRIIGAVNPRWAQIAGERDMANPFQPPKPEPLKWLLMVHEAKSLGISASNFEVKQLLDSAGTNLANLQRDLKKGDLFVEQESIAEAFRKYLMVVHYRNLILAHGHATRTEMMLLDGIGRPILSRPVLERFVYDERSKVTVSALPLTVDLFLDDAPEPTEDAVKELFDKHKNDAKGAGEPHGFGYRIPASVKIEYLTFPFDDIANSIDVSFADVQAHYNTYKSLYREKPDPDEKIDPDNPKPPKFRELETDAALVGEIKREIREQRARGEFDFRTGRPKSIGKVEQMARAARKIMLDQISAERDGQNYYKLGSAFNPVPLDEVAKQLQKRFGVLPTVVVRGDIWLDREELEAQVGFGDSVLLSDGRGVRVVDYVFSVKELAGTEVAENPLALERLQVDVPGKPLKAPGGDNWYVFRVTEVRQPREPESVDAVREQVAKDAKELSIYKSKLLGEKDEWVRRATAASLDTLAEDFKKKVKELTPFARIGDDDVAATNFDEVEDDAAFIRQVFEHLEKIDPKTRENLAALPIEQRILAVTDDRGMALHLVRLDKYEPITQKTFDSEALGYNIGFEFNARMAGDSFTVDPLSLDSIKRRVGFEYIRDEDEEESSDDAAE